MQLHKSSDRGRKVESFRGQVEVLEGRVLLSCTVKEVGGVLLIRGTNATADIVRIEDEGTNVGGAISVRCNNGPANAVVPVATNVGLVRKVMIDTGRGDDLVDYSLAVGATLGVPRNVTLNLGPGKNIGKVGVGQATINANMGVDVRSGNGNDIISFDAAAGVLPTMINTNVTVTVNAGLGDDKVDVAADLATINGALVLNAKGGAGVDKLGATAVDVVLGNGGLLNLTLDGGPGIDTLDAGANIISAGVGSQVKISLLGSDHNDKLGLAFAGTAPTIALLINGGLGTDTCELPVGFGPPQLTVIGCEL